MNHIFLIAITSIFETTGNKTNSVTTPITNTPTEISLFSPLGFLLFFGLIFVSVLLIFMIRWWMTQTAIFKMQEDINDIKNKMDTKEKTSD